MLLTVVKVITKLLSMDTIVKVGSQTILLLVTVVIITNKIYNKLYVIHVAKLVKLVTIKLDYS